MHVVFQHPHVLPVKKYGGIERLILWQMKDLARLGHRVTLLGHPDSRLESFGITTIAATTENWRSLLPRDADVLHLYYPLEEDLGVPYLCYIAGNAKPGEHLPMNAVFASAAHASVHGSRCFVHHGIDFGDYASAPRLNRGNDWQKFSFLAKASWKVKNLKDCIRAVKRTRKDLYIGGGKRFTLSPRLHYLGMLTDEESCALYDRTDAFLWPVLWPEPFGLAPIVAMSRGLPVIASVHGSSPELIRDAGVGRLCQNYGEFEAAIRDRGAFLPAAEIRDYAMQTFPVRKMTEAFLEKYQLVMSGQRLNENRPRVAFTTAADKVLLKF